MNLPDALVLEAGINLLKIKECLPLLENCPSCQFTYTEKDGWCIAMPYVAFGGTHSNDFRIFRASHQCFYELLQLIKKEKATANQSNT